MAHDMHLSAEERKQAKIKNILRVTAILSIVTAAEFAVAFIPDGAMGGLFDRGPLLTALFFIMTIVKAYYIVSEFMHLGHEVRSLKYAVVFPMAFVVWLVIALLVEGTAIFDANM
jgi:cytochrome c oxidase subunit IV